MYLTDLYCTTFRITGQYKILFIGHVFPYTIFKKACKYKENWTSYHANYVKGAMILPDEIPVSNWYKYALYVSLNPRSQKNKPL